MKLPPKLDHLHPHGRPGPQSRHHLAVVDHDRQPPRRLSHHLLPEKRTPEALDEVELGIDLIGAVDRQIEAWGFGQGGQRNAQFPGLRGRAERGRHSDDAMQLACLESNGKRDQ